MPGFAHFLRCVGNAVVKNGGRTLAGLVPFGDALYEIATSAYEDYRKDRGEPELRAELQGLAQASPAEVHQAAEHVAANESVEVRRALVSYLDQFPAAIHQSLRRPSDPGGKTVPNGRSLSKPEDLLAFLPAGLPRFKPGDQPLAADWELVEMLGKGGFGEVWKARHLMRTVQKPVALKFCLDPVAARSLRNEATLHDLLERVRQEGGGKGIVPLLDTFLRADPPCLMYELIEGGDLTGLIQEMHQQGNLTPELATRIVHRLASTVAFAHKLDPPLVHRDLKPSNVLVRRGEDNKIRLFVADFGIGGLAARQSLQEQASRRGIRSQTLPTAVRGAYTPLYASPQQVQGERPDPRDDVHALGVIWYQLVTGDLKLMSIPPDWQVEVEERGLGKECVGLLALCLAGRAGRRLPNAAELSDRLSRVAGRAKAAAEAEAKAAAEAEAKAEAEDDDEDDEEDEAEEDEDDEEDEEAEAEAEDDEDEDDEDEDDEDEDDEDEDDEDEDDEAEEDEDDEAEEDEDDEAEEDEDDEDEDDEDEDGSESTTTLEIKNSIGMKFRLIPAGSFRMGSPDNDQDRSADEVPAHEVQITQPFYLGVHPVTQEQYQQVMGTNPSSFSATGKRKHNVRGLDTRSFPVEGVSWEDAQTFLERLSAQPQEKARGRKYRLPMEAEWEYACRGGATSYQVFHFGNSLSSKQANFDGNYPYDAEEGPYLDRPCAVGSYTPNAFGLWDMHGNVWEWCADWYDEDYYASSPREDPPGPSEGAVRVVRGGPWYFSGSDCRSAYRNCFAPDYRNDGVGFRVTLVPEERK